jgi:hypothetical protein
MEVVVKEAPQPTREQMAAQLQQQQQILVQRATALMAEMVDALGFTIAMAETGDPGARQLLGTWLSHVDKARAAVTGLSIVRTPGGN